MKILALDIAGVPRQWCSLDDAIRYHTSDSVAWSLGEVVARFRGGIQRTTGLQSYAESRSIIAVRGRGFDPGHNARVFLTNHVLFRRDRNTCAYCGNHFPNYLNLSRDHIIPRSRAGANDWLNTITACKGCNWYKDNKTPREAGLEMFFQPYEPNHWEGMILESNGILEEQLEYLQTGLPKHSRARIKL